MLVVSDTTPLLYLARVGRLDLLREIYAEVVVPQTVWDELVEARPDAPGVLAVRAAAGRRAAGKLGVAVRGTLGVLVAAKAAGEGPTSVGTT